MSHRNQADPSTYNRLMFSEEDESNPSILIGHRPRLHDEESLVRQPPKPAELNSLCAEPDPDLQLTPLKQREQPKGLLRSHACHSKVRHRVRFQESGSLSCESESEQEISNKISEVTITDNISDCELLTQENQNNNNGNVKPSPILDVSSPNASNCMFFDPNSCVLSPQLMSVEVIREIGQSQKPSPPILTSDVPSETNSQTERNNSQSQPPHQNGDRIPLFDISTETMTPKDIHFENPLKEGNPIMQKRKTLKSVSDRSSPSQVGTMSANLPPGNSQTSSLSVNVSSLDKEQSLFAQPQLHSTLQIAQKIKTLQKKRPDLTNELKKNLEKEEQRNKINEKAATKVDIHSSQDLYSGLISLDVSNFELEEAAIVQRTTKGKYAKKKTTTGLEPDLLEFFSEDLQKESADFSLPGIGGPVIKTCNAPSLIAFDLYRHNRMWDGLPGIL